MPQIYRGTRGDRSLYLKVDPLLREVLPLVHLLVRMLLANQSFLTLRPQSKLKAHGLNRTNF